jgi:hydrogenase/urease accessory protein HupE
MGALRRELEWTLVVSVDGEARPAKIDRVVRPDGVWQIWLAADAASPRGSARTVRIEYRLLDRETDGAHVNMAYVYRSERAGDDVQRIFDFSQPAWQTTFERGATFWEATVPAPARPEPRRRRAVAEPAPVAAPVAAAPVPAPQPERAAAAPTVPAPGRTSWSDVARFVLLGIEHILSGYDHIAFLLALVVVAPSIRAVVPIATAFTAAHSVTLLLAALGVVDLPPRLVECAIALSICWVAAENVLRRDATHRWLPTFGFGLLHGFGFASALRELIVGKGNLVVSVVSFNLGVELGQLIIVADALPVLWALGRLVEQRKVALGASAAIAVLGGAWLLERGLDVRIFPS